MNPNLPTNKTGTERFVNPSAHPGVRPVGMNPYNNPQIRSVRMESLHPNGRNDSNYQLGYMQKQDVASLQNTQNQYQQQQQNIMQQNQRQLNMQQQNLRFPAHETLIRPQASQGYNQQPNSTIHKSSGSPLESQRNQIAPQIRPAGPQQPLKPQNHPNGVIPVNQSNGQNNQRMEPPKTPSDRIQINLQYASHSENHKTELPGDTSVNLQINKSSDTVKRLPNGANSNQNPSEAAGKSRASGLLGSTPETEMNERKSDFQKAQTPVLSATESEADKLSAEGNKSKLSELGKKEKEAIADTKTKEKSQKENKKQTNRDESITSGVVQKNIKFFEENDTAKTPLRPGTIQLQKRKQTMEVPGDVVKSDTHEEEYERGVDETPVVHPNLGSIFQVPRKVAKIPYSKTRKSSKKIKTKGPSEERINKKQIYRRPLSEFLKPGRSYSPYKPGIRKTEKTKSYGSKEELLAFFENTKSWRKLKRYESKADQKAERDEVVNKPTTNGDIPTPKKTPSRLQTPSKKNQPVSPTKTPLKSPGTPGTPGPKSLPKTPESPAPPTPLIKKVPMNKIQVGAAPSPNLKTVKSKVGSLANTTHKPGGGNVKIESHKIDLSKVQPRTEAKNDMYKPSGGEKKIQQVKLQWSAKSKIGSLENATYKPGGGDKKIESVKLDFKEKAKPKVGSKDNVKHVPGGGNVKIDNQKLEFKAQSKVGSLDNVKHKPGGGDIKIFDDKTYLRQISGNSSEGRASGTHAYNDLSVVREVEGRSAPGTPGRKTSVKIKKITAIENLSDYPKIKNITKVTVTSQAPKNEKNADKSPAKQQVKVTYAKISSTKNGESELPVGIVRLPAKDDAPLLKPSLSKKDLLHDPVLGGQTDESKNETDLNKAVLNKSVRIAGDVKENSVSPNLPESKSNRDDSGLSKFLQDEIATQEKIGEIWRERNNIDIKANVPNIRRQDGPHKESSQTYFPENYDYGSNHRQIRPQNPESSQDTQIIPNESRHLNFHSSVSMHSDQTSQNQTLTQSQQQRQMNQLNSFFPP